MPFSVFLSSIFPLFFSQASICMIVKFQGCLYPHSSVVTYFFCPVLSLHRYPQWSVSKYYDFHRSVNLLPDVYAKTVGSAPGSRSLFHNCLYRFSYFSISAVIMDFAFDVSSAQYSPSRRYTGISSSVRFKSTTMIRPSFPNALFHTSA